jgi:hypothetical protein
MINPEPILPFVIDCCILEDPSSQDFALPPTHNNTQFPINFGHPPSESQKIIYNIFKNSNISYKNLTYKLKKF